MWYRLLATAIMILFATALLAQEVPNATSESTTKVDPQSLSALRYQQQVVVLAQAETGGGTADPAVTPGRYNGAKATLLSAIMPGTGQLYLESKWKGYGFLALEATAWTLAIMYNVQGSDKDKEFKKFADLHWSEGTYRSKEFELAREPVLENRQSGLNNSYFTGDSLTWISLPWSGSNTGPYYSQSYWLPRNFTHELPGDKTQQYYEMIGKYLTQFGFAWDDQSGDITTTKGVWDGSSMNASKYADMRYESNKLLKLGNSMFMVVMLNHTFSALDAAFTAHNKNASAVQTSLNIDSRYFNGELVSMPTLSVRF